MAMQIRNRPRKLPRQARSRATFEAIVQAGEQLLCRNGFDALRMNALAERAGVSPGSLYQYFPNQEAVVELIAERKLAEIHRLVGQTLGAHRKAPAAESMNAVLAMLVSYLRAELPLMRELAKSDVFLCDSPTMSGYLGSLPELIVRCARRRPRGFRLHPDRTRSAFAVLTRVVWDTCRETLASNPESLCGPRFLAELELLARTMLLTGTFESRSSISFSARNAWSAVREAASGLQALPQIA